MPASLWGGGGAVWRCRERGRGERWREKGPCGPLFTSDLPVVLDVMFFPRSLQSVFCTFFRAGVFTTRPLALSSAMSSGVASIEDPEITRISPDGSAPSCAMSSCGAISNAMCGHAQSSDNRFRIELLQRSSVLARPSIELDPCTTSFGCLSIGAVISDSVSWHQEETIENCYAQDQVAISSKNGFSRAGVGVVQP